MVIQLTNHKVAVPIDQLTNEDRQLPEVPH